MWQKTIRKCRIDNNGMEITKANVPMILSGIEDPAMPKNKVSGFRATGSHPFNVNNVDFSKIILRQVETSNNADIEEEKHHLHYIEGQIEPAIAQFKGAKAKNYDWDERLEQQKLKEHRKRDRELKRKERNKKTATKSSRKKQVEETSSEEEEWVERGSIIDNIDDENQEQDEILLFSVEDSNLGDYILASFQSVGKRASSNKYVSKILKILPENAYEIQGLRSLDGSKIVFKYIDNDMSLINKSDILGKLPDPQLIQDGRILKISFPTAVDVFEKK
ncbi:hypothetical protein JTB14_019124 [Gonioctena quinquepunctata]|nr:hypothetical protein JTB14_019124 [Gonioctena quinquepunctata]